MSGKDRLAAGMKLILAVLATAAAYALFAVLYNGIVGEDAELDVVPGAIRVAVVGSLTILLLWIYQQDRRKRE